MPEAPLQEKLAGIFAELSQHVFRKSLPIKSLERLNMVSRKFALIILQAAERTALKKCKALNDAVKKGFGRMAKDIAELQSQVEKLDCDLTGTLNELADMKDKVEELEAKVNAQHSAIKELAVDEYDSLGDALDRGE